jgi:hypothetical protein
MAGLGFYRDGLDFDQLACHHTPDVSRYLLAIEVDGDGGRVGG